MQKICQTAELYLIKLLIKQQEKNAGADTEAISSPKSQLAELFPDQTKGEQAERRIHSATSRSASRIYSKQKAFRQTEPRNNELCIIRAKLNELTTLMNTFSKCETFGKKRFQVSLLLSLHVPTPCDPLAKVKKRQIKRKTHNILPQQKVSSKTSTTLLVLCV